MAAIRHDLARFRARLRCQGEFDVQTTRKKLHFGCGYKKVEGWLNVDLQGSDFDIDLAAGRLPFATGAFEAALGEHVIEHLEIDTELLPLLREIARVLDVNGEVWLSCPDIEKICVSYVRYSLLDLLEDRRRRLPGLFLLGDKPTSHMINQLFHQDGEHRNLFDLSLLEWVLTKAGFGDIQRVEEADLLHRFPGFPPRGDDKQSIYVRARARHARALESVPQPGAAPPPSSISRIYVQGH